MAMFQRKHLKKVGAVPSSETFEIGDTVITKDDRVGLLKEVMQKDDILKVKIAFLDNDEIDILAADEIRQLKK